MIGRLIADPELSFLPGDGKAVCKFKLAVKREYTKDKSDFINCISWGKQGETIAQYFTKGKPIAVTGSIRTGSYDAKDGTKRYTTDIVVDSFEFIGSNKNENQATQSDSNQDSFYDDMTPEDTSDMPF